MPHKSNLSGPHLRQMLVPLALVLLLAFVSVAQAQVGTTVVRRPDHKEAINTVNRNLETIPSADAFHAVDADDATDPQRVDNARAGAVATSSEQANAAEATGKPARSEANYFPIYGAVDTFLVEQLVEGALQSPEVRKLFGDAATLFVDIQDKDFIVHISGVDATAQPARDEKPGDADYVLHASSDAARALANAIDPSYTAMKLIQGHYVTVEAQKLTHQAAVKALYSGFLDSQLKLGNQPNGATRAQISASATDRLEAYGFQALNVNGIPYVANDLGGIVAAYSPARPALHDVHVALGIELSSSAGMLVTSLPALAAQLNDDAVAALQSQLGSGIEASHTLDANRLAALAAGGAPDPFLIGIDAAHLASLSLDAAASEASQ